MPNPVLVMDYANMFCGSAPSDDQSSNHLVLAQVQLPKMETQYVDHRPGGAPVAVEIDVIMARLECTFALIGWTTQVMKLLGRHSPGSNDFFIYGNVREQHGTAAFQAEARIRGQLAAITPSPFSRGAVQLHEYAIRGIMEYELKLATMPIIQWNFYTNTWAIGGDDQDGAATPSVQPPLPSVPL